MIQINLLDQVTAGKAKASAAGAFSAVSPRPSSGGGGGALIALAAIAMLALNGSLFWMAYQNVHASSVEVEQVSAQQRKLKDEIGRKMTEADQIRKYREVVANQMDVLKSLDPEDRILWCEKVNELSNLMPPNVFLAEVKINEDVKMVETAQSKAAHEKWEKAVNKDQQKEPPVVQKPVISYNVRLTGLALGKDNVEQMHNVTEFHKALIDYSEKAPDGKDHKFMDGFNNNIEFESVEATTYEGTPVNKFIFKLTTKPMGEDTPDAKAAPAKPARGSKQIMAGITADSLSNSEAKTLASN